MGTQGTIFSVFLKQFVKNITHVPYGHGTFFLKRHEHPAWRSDLSYFTIRRSTDQLPPPVMSNAKQIPINNKWYSYPSPAWVPNQFMKKPCRAFVVIIAPTMRMMKAAAHNLVRNPAINRTDPSDSSQMMPTAISQGSFIVSVKNVTVFL